MISTSLSDRLRLSRLKKRGYLWVTLGFFAVSISAQWVFGWFSYVEERKDHN